MTENHGDHPIVIIIDQAAAERAAELVPQMPERTLAYVYSGAVCVGLNRLSALGRCTPADFTPEPAPGGQRAEVELGEYDKERAEQLARALRVPVEHVIGAAIFTGLATLTAKAGPFRIGVTPITATPVHGPFTLET